MLLFHLIVGLALGAAAALGGWFSGLSTLAALGLYVLGGNLGIVASVAVQFVWAAWGRKAVVMLRNT
jgi:hypothetical protein